MSLHSPNKHRIRTGPMGSDDSYGNDGAFDIPLKTGQRVKVICGTFHGWEHVSVSRSDRCPTWEEMCQVKNLFWDEEDVVIQFHPAKKDYVNNHPFCLHMWRKIGYEFPTPDPFLVGFL